MVKEALKISAAAGCYKATLSSNLKRDRAHAFTNHWLSATRLEFQS